MNCRGCEHFSGANNFSMMDQSSCSKTGDLLCLTTHFKGYSDARYDEISKENKSLKVQSDWLHYVELVNTSVGNNCPL